MVVDESFVENITFVKRSYQNVSVCIVETYKDCKTEHPKTLPTLYLVNITYENSRYHESYIQR
jgi:hypothetical protein